MYNITFTTTFTITNTIDYLQLTKFETQNEPKYFLGVLPEY